MARICASTSAQASPAAVSSERMAGRSSRRQHFVPGRAMGRVSSLLSPCSLPGPPAASVFPAANALARWARGNASVEGAGGADTVSPGRRTKTLHRLLLLPSCACPVHPNHQGRQSVWTLPYMEQGRIGVAIVIRWETRAMEAPGAARGFRGRSLRRALCLAGSPEPAAVAEEVWSGASVGRRSTSGGHALQEEGISHPVLRPRPTAASDAALHRGQGGVGVEAGGLCHLERDAPSLAQDARRGTKQAADGRAGAGQGDDAHPDAVATPRRLTGPWRARTGRP